MKFFGITHNVKMKNLPSWKKKNCIKNIHAFDEVFSMKDHYLSCDACGLIVNISSVDTTYVDESVLASVDVDVLNLCIEQVAMKNKNI